MVVGSGADQVTYYVADVVVQDATQLLGGFAENKFGANIVADTSDIADDYNAILAINGDYYGYRDSGIVIRNGVLFRDDGARIGLAMYTDGTMAVYDETTTTGEQLIADGVWNTVSFGPALLDDGEIVDGIEDIEIDTNIGNHSIQGNQPRTGIGVVSANHFVFVVVDGRSAGGPDYATIFDTLRSLGCDVIGHPTNLGKGSALKHGFAHIESHYPNEDVVCADCDGQHAYTDIARVASELRLNGSRIVLGARRFAGNVPARSRFGNSLTRSVLAVLTGLRLQDTQTGLRVVAVGGHPSTDTGVRTSGLPQLRNDVGVEQISVHKST